MPKRNVHRQTLATRTEAELEMGLLGCFWVCWLIFDALTLVSWALNPFVDAN